MIDIGYSSDNLIKMKKYLIADNDVNSRGFPVFINGNQLTGICPYCFDVHSHGLHEEMLVDWDRNNGRLSHCLNFRAEHYVLFNMGLITPEIDDIFNKIHKAARYLDGCWERYNYDKMIDESIGTMFLQNPDKKMSQVELRKMINCLRRRNIDIFKCGWLYDKDIGKKEVKK
jgi:hypothetical protein